MEEVFWLSRAQTRQQREKQRRTWVLCKLIQSYSLKKQDKTKIIIYKKLINKVTISTEF